MYDYVIVGAGLYGAVFASEMSKRGKRCMVLDKRPHIGGNLYTKNIEGINVHQYGAHIFHTDNEDIWKYINQYGQFNNYINSPLANYKGEIYNLPFNMNTFYRMWGKSKPHEVQAVIESQKNAIKGEPKNLEEQAISLVGLDVYEKLIKGYTEKQWGRDCKDLPSFIIKRLPVRFTYDNNYFTHRYQGIPMGGYAKIIEKMLINCEVSLDTDYLSDRKYWDKKAKRVIFTGPIDGFYDYNLGELEYRSLKFDTEIIDSPNYQGCAVVNYTDRETPFTRIIEHKHFEFGNQTKTVISKEYSTEWKVGDEPYYPINDEQNIRLYNKYNELAKQEEKVVFGGRLGEYKYYDMDQVIIASLERVHREL